MVSKYGNLYRRCAAVPCAVRIWFWHQVRALPEHVINQQKVKRERVRVLPWALDPEFETILPAASKTPPPSSFPAGRVILTVGRWLASERYKGMDTLITSLPRLLPRWPELQLAMIGEGDRSRLVGRARGQKRSALPRAFPIWTFVCAASLVLLCLRNFLRCPSHAEGFGLVYLEAMACGKPVIGGAHGGAPEVIVDGVTGYLVQYGDVDQLSTSIETLLSEPALARDMGARGCERVEHQFRFTVFAKALKKILREQCES